jgi:SpoVK/Ycf46/Vps4 family AAA+-type ATPase
MNFFCRFEFCGDVRLEEVIEHVPEVPLTGADIYGMCADAWKIALRRRITQIQKGGE